MQNAHFCCLVLHYYLPIIVFILLYYLQEEFISYPSMVDIYAHLHTDHSLFHGLVPLSATEAFL